METIAEAKQHLRKHWLKGVTCPCCGQLVKQYRRKLNSGMALCLIHLYQINKSKTGERWIKVTTEVLARGANPITMEYPKLKYWDFIESKGEQGAETKSAGLWRITQRGIDFVEGKLTTPKYVRLYNNHFLGQEGEPTSIFQALGSKFNYKELMRGQ